MLFRKKIRPTATKRPNSPLRPARKRGHAPTGRPNWPAARAPAHFAKEPPASELIRGALAHYSTIDALYKQALKVPYLHNRAVLGGPAHDEAAPAGTACPHRPTEQSTGLTSRSMSTVEPKQSPELWLKGRRCLLIPCPHWRTTRHGGVPIPTTLRPSESVVIAREKKELTTKPSVQLVEPGKPGNL
jgi:hypothetical protein